MSTRDMNPPRPLDTVQPLSRKDRESLRNLLSRLDVGDTVEDIASADVLPPDAERDLQDAQEHISTARRLIERACKRARA